MPQRKTGQHSAPLGEDAAVELGTLTDGTILTSAADGAPYLFQDGRRKRILSPAGVLAAGVDLHSSAAQQLTLSEEQLQRIPSAGLLAPAGTRQFDSGLTHLGTNHWMRTWGVLELGTGQISAQTRTATFTWFGGYHGATYVIFSDANDAPVFQSSLHRYGVDGTAIGTSDRTDAWWEHATDRHRPDHAPCRLPHVGTRRLRQDPWPLGRVRREGGVPDLQRGRRGGGLRGLSAFTA